VLLKTGLRIAYVRILARATACAKVVKQHINITVYTTNQNLNTSKISAKVQVRSVLLYISPSVNISPKMFAVGWVEQLVFQFLNGHNWVPHLGLRLICLFRILGYHIKVLSVASHLAWGCFYYVRSGCISYRDNCAINWFITWGNPYVCVVWDWS